MKYWTLTVAAILTSCATPPSRPAIVTTVNSISNLEDEATAVPLFFPKVSSAVEFEKLRRQCEQAALGLKIPVIEECTKGCHFVYVSGENSGYRQTVGTHSTPSAVTTVVSGENQRYLKVSIYSDNKGKDLVYEAALNSDGSSSNVLSVGHEMCVAAFLAYPNEVTGKVFRVEQRPFEQTPKSPGFLDKLLGW